MMFSRRINITAWVTMMLVSGSSCCRTGSARLDILSMQFTHPHLFETRIDFPRENALLEMQRRRLLRRGMTVDQVRALLGYPESTSSDAVNHTDYKEWVLPGKDEATLPPLSWYYDLNASGLTIEFDPNRRIAERFRWHYDEGGPDDRVW